MKSTYLDQDISYIKGIGPVRATLLRDQLGYKTSWDVLMDFPVKHIDRSHFSKIQEIKEEGVYVQLVGVIVYAEIIGEQRNRRLCATLKDETGSIELIWFRSIQNIWRHLPLNKPVLVYGRVGLFQRKFNIPHPEIEIPGDDQNPVGERIYPRYRSTEKLNAQGIDDRIRRNMVMQILSNVKPDDIKEFLPKGLLDKFRLMSRYEAICQIHFPDSQQKLIQAERRLKFEELFLHQLSLLLNQKWRQRENQGYRFETVGEKFNTYYQKVLPFELTNAQKRVVKEIRKDMARPIQMNRLLQGDVGSGKTMVALLSILIAVDNGFQCCFMAPTEILANQHYQSLAPDLEKIGVSTAFLTGNVKGKSRKSVLSGLTNGDIKVLVGTHAVLEDPVVFHKLGLVIIDEQHRFGVAQRAKLWQKAKPYPPHILVMTATPIPRTLAMTLYGDLDVSIIDELPPGRKPVKTVHKTEYVRPDLIKFMQNQIQEGRQIYVVYPLIEESEKMDLENLQSGYEKLLHRFPPPHYQISIVHGKLRQEDKDFEMSRFVKGETHIMVATTVIEVGVNVPNATVMVIENAERFGLSQLHQLRGRVGRGADQSYCILMTGYKISDEARIRLETMCSTNDGFKIAEVDLQLRGPGAIEGTQQSGLPNFKIANIARDGDIIAASRKAVMDLLEKDPRLQEYENLPLRQYISQNMKEIGLWSQIS